MRFSDLARTGDFCHIIRSAGRKPHPGDAFHGIEIDAGGDRDVGHSVCWILGDSPPVPRSRRSPRTNIGRRALVVVDGQNITEADLQRFMKTRQVPAESRDKARRPLLEEMVDARLMRHFLASKKISAKKDEVDQQVQQIQDQAAKRGTDPEKVLVEMGYTTESLRDEFALPLAWKRYVDGRITPAQVQKYFAAHRAEFDGTRVRASQIMFKVPVEDRGGF